MINRHGSRIRQIESNELTGITEVELDDGTTDQLYVAADQLPIMRDIRPPEPDVFR